MQRGWGRVMRVIVNELAVQESRSVQERIAELPGPHFDFTSFCCSCLDQVRDLFRKIKRGIIACGVSVAVDDLGRKVMHSTGR